MNILVLEPHPDFGGGSEAVILSLSSKLARRGHDVSLLCATDGTMTAQYALFTRRILHYPLPGFPRRRPLKIIECIRAVGRAVRLSHAETILSSHLGFIEVAACVRQFYGVSSLFHLGLPPPTLTLARRLAYPRLGFGIAPSKHTMDGWAGNGWPLDKLATIPNWVDTDIFAPDERPSKLRLELGIPLDVPCIVYVGRLSHEKGTSLLLGSFALLAQTIPKVVLVLVGRVESGYVQSWEETIRALPPYIRERVLVKGVTSQPYKFFAAADIACVPSLVESFGLTVLEAMACAVPVVASNTGIFSELIGDSELIFQKEYPKTLYKVLHHWLTRPEACRKKGDALRQRAIKLHGPDKSVDAYEKRIHDLVNRP